MNTTYKYCLRLNNTQKNRIDSWIGCCRLIYNTALSLKQDAFRKSIPISFNDLQKQLPDLKDIEWVKDVPAQSLQAVIQKLERSYKNFFEGRASFPKYQSKKRTNSILFKSVVQVSHNTFKLPKIGEVKIFNDRQPKGELKNATIIKELNRYYLCVVCETEKPTASPCDNQVGIDVGISNFAVLSDGTFVEHPKFLIKSERQLRKAQRKLSRAKKRAKNWYKKVQVVQKIHQKVRRQRQDFLHKLSTSIVKTNQVIAVEKLNIKGMVRSNLAKHISDSGWGYFKGMLHYKSEWYGRTFVEVNPQYTSQECFVCGHISSNNRKTQSEFLCENCDHTNHADWNGSKIILRRGQRLLAQSTSTSSRLAKEPRTL